MTTPDPLDPRLDVVLSAGMSVEQAAALVQAWLFDNTDGVRQRVQFVIELDNFMTDYDFTLGCVKGLAAELPERGL